MKIIVIDDDKLVSLSLKTILENTNKITVSAMGESGEEALGLYEFHKPDVVLMDIRMEKISGLEAGEIILKKYPDAKILYLTTFSDDEYIVKALNMGAKGYILKQDFESIPAALETVLNGQSVFGNKIIERLPDLMKARGRFDHAGHGISDKEKEIIELVAAGFSNKEISGKLYLSEGTVRNYISSLLEKLYLRDRTQLAIFYYTNMNDEY